MAAQLFEIHCMMCGTEVGEVRGGRFQHHASCDRPLVVRGGFLRCCRCGGSLYRERGDELQLRLRRATAAPQLTRAG